MQIRLSPSRLKLHATCALAYYDHYIDGHDDPSGDAADMGTAAHSGAESAFRLVQAGLITSIDEFELHALKGYQKRWVELGHLPLGQLFDDGVDCIRKLSQQFAILPEPGDILSLESKRETTYTTLDGNEVLLTQIIDMTERTGPASIVCRDWKTGWVLPQREEMRSDPQAAIYAMSLAEEYPDATITTAWHFLRHGCVMTVEWDRKTLEGVKCWLLGYADSLIKDAAAGKEAFPPTLNSACAWRSCQHRCPKFLQDVESYDDIKLSDPISVIEAYQEASALSKAWEERKSKLYRALVQHLDHGSIENDGRRWSMDTTCRKSIDFSGLMAVSLAAGLPVDAFYDAVSVSLPKTIAVVKGLGAEARTLAESVIEGQTREVFTPRLSSRKL